VRLRVPERDLDGASSKAPISLMKIIGERSIAGPPNTMSLRVRLAEHEHR
jgi:hypothetical protein